MRFIDRTTYKRCITLDLRMVLYYHAVVDHGYISRDYGHAILVKSGGGINDIVGLPFAGFAGRIDQRRSLFVNRTRLSVGICTIFVTVEHLDRKSTRLNSSHVKISYAVFCLKTKSKCGQYRIV